MSRSAPSPAGDGLDRLVALRTRVDVEEVANQAPAEPLVSVIVPTYNHVGFIRQCVAAVLEQHTAFAFEVLIGEDGSSDGTREACLELARAHPERIRLFLHRPENRIAIGGVPTGRFNLAHLLSRARGRYIAWCDGDDYWTDADKLSRQVACLEASPAHVLCFGNALVWFEGRTTSRRLLAPNFEADRSAVDLACGKPVPTQTVMFRNVFPGQPFPAAFFDVLNGDTFLFAWLGRFGAGKYLPGMGPSVQRWGVGGLWNRQSLPAQHGHRLRTLEALASIAASEEALTAIDGQRTVELARGIYASLRTRGLGQALRQAMQLTLRLLRAPRHLVPLLHWLGGAWRRRPDSP